MVGYLCRLSIEHQVEHELFLARSVLSQHIIGLVHRVHQHHQLHTDNIAATFTSTPSKVAWWCNG